MYWSKGNRSRVETGKLLGLERAVMQLKARRLKVPPRDGYGEQWVAVARKMMNGVKACQIRCRLRRAKPEWRYIRDQRTRIPPARWQETRRYHSSGFLLSGELLDLYQRLQSAGWTAAFGPAGLR
jgi:hypothetical protein